MASEIFYLEPFEPLSADIALSIGGRVTLEGTKLTIAYLLSGDLEKVAIASNPSSGPSSGSTGARRDRLWEQTCFEFFLACGPAPTKATPYWEFNLSPSGDWNVFALEGYRRGLKEETAISNLSFDVERKPESIYLNLWEMDVSDLATGDRPLWVGVSAVVVLKSEQTFWAIAHPGTEADFHHPKSFVLSL